LGAIKKLKLLKHFKTVENLYNTTKEDLLQIPGIGKKTSEIILNQNIKKKLDKHIEYMLKNNIDIISITDKEYPQILKEIYDAPISLYIRGNKNILNDDALAIIGCRECTSYGRNITKQLAYDIAKNKINIVSGLAKGIDAIAHKGAILSGGKTIAVLGNGLDIIYPSENIPLAKEIIKTGGAIISEYPLGTKPEKQNFPERNRIVSGMSKGVVVVEAKEKSGTLITVDFALEQGRDVFVVPGNINQENSIGTNELIKQGAKLITSYKDVIEEYKKGD
jgi:DNA processing protein